MNRLFAAALVSVCVVSPAYSESSCLTPELIITHGKELAAKVPEIKLSRASGAEAKVFFQALQAEMKTRGMEAEDLSVTNDEIVFAELGEMVRVFSFHDGCMTGWIEIPAAMKNRLIERSQANI